MEINEEFEEGAELRINPNIDEQKIISLDKFLILSIFSLGLYIIWWATKLGDSLSKRMI